MNQPSPYFIRRSAPSSDAGTIDLQEFMSVEDQHDSLLRDYWRVMRRHQWLVLFCAFSLLIGAGLYTFTRTPLYTAKATILIERKPPQVLKVQDARSEVFEYDYNNEFYKTQYEILKSPALAERVIRDEALQSHPLFGGDKNAKRPGLVALLWVPLREWLGGLYRREPGESAVPKRNQAVSATASPAIVGGYLSMLGIRPVSGTGLVEIMFTTPNRDVSASLANAHAFAYARYGIDLRSRTNEEATEFLEQKLLELKERVEQSEAALNAYRRDKGIISLDDKQNVVIDRLFDLNKSLTTAETERVALEAQVRAIRAGQYDALSASLNSPVIHSLKSDLGKLETEYASLSKEFKPGYPPLDNLKARIEESRRNLRGEIQNELKGVESAYAAAKAKENELRARMEEQKQIILRLKDSGVQYAILAREVDTNRQLYDSVLQRMKEMGVAAELRTSNVYVMGKAQPPAGPSYPNTRRSLLLGLLMGLAAGIGLALLLEQLDNTFKSPEEAERYSHLPNLAVVPDFARINGSGYGYMTRLVGAARSGLPSAASDDADRHLVHAHHPLSLIAEAYRTLRSSLLLSHAGAPPHVVLMTSATRGEGKTTSLINSAIVFAQMGVRVLVIDADLRRPRCHKLLKVDNEVGLAEVLAGQIGSQKAIQSTAIENLFLLSSGATAPNPAELLGSRKMHETLEQLREQFEFIFIDSSPVMAVSDAVLVSTMVEGVLLVVNGKTAKPMVKKACARLRSAHAKILGIVLNQVDIRHGDYATYYRHYYEYYHQSPAREA